MCSQDTRQQLQAKQKQMEQEIAEQGRQLSVLEARLATEPAKQRALTLQVQSCNIYRRDHLLMQYCCIAATAKI